MMRKENFFEEFVKSYKAYPVRRILILLTVKADYRRGQTVSMCMKNNKKWL